MTDSLLRDVKYSLRVLLKSPGFFIAAVLILGLGIGANTVMFSVVNAVVLRPLPFQDAEQLVHVWHVPPPVQFPGVKTFSVSPANYLDWRAQNNVFEHMSIYTPGGATLTGPGQEPDFVRAGLVSADFFDVLAVRPLHGRLFQPGEDEQGHDQVVVLEEALWQTRYGGDPGIIGRSIVINRRPRVVVGIVASSQGFPADRQLWLPLAFTAEQRATRGIHDFTVIARLKPGVSVTRAQAEMNTISRRLEQQYPADNTGWGAIVVSLQDDIVGDTKTALLILLGAVGFVMLIVSANLANLLLAKTLGRSREIALRTALGAGRRQLVQQILCETLLLGFAGGALGLLFATFSLEAIVSFVAQEVPRANEINLDGSVLAFAFAVSIVAGIIAGLVPAWRLTRATLHDILKQGLTRTTASASERRVRNALVVVEVALALVLRAVDPGFDPRSVLTAVVVAPPPKYAAPADWSRFFTQLVERVRTIPGVETVAAIDSLPMTGGSMQPIAAEDQPPRPMSEQPEVAVRRIMPDYLRATRTRLIAGRSFNDADVADRLPVVLVSESMARQFWPNQNPIGKRLTLTFRAGVIREVVGVVADVKLRGLDATEPVAALYTPYAQMPSPAMSLVVRTTVPPMSVGPLITAAVHEIDSELPVLRVRTLDEVVGASIAQQRFAMQLLGAFAGLALFLAAIGIYSVLSYTVRQRVPEIGIRMAIGALRWDVVRMIVGDGMKPTLLGAVVGLAGAVALGRLISTMIFGVTPYDVITLGAVATIIVFVGALASLVPAYRATRIDPVIALREEQ